MDPDIKAEWVRRLREDNIPQTTNGLLGDVNGRRCCLGVLCDIAVEHGVIPLPEGGSALVYGDKEKYVLPRVVAEWASIDCTGRYYSTKSLAIDNDNGMPFPKIADVIEEYF
jgi:hypothetical protein